MNLVPEFYSKLPDEKIKINWNKNPIKMDLFLSFLTVEVVRSHDHLGDCNGWTLLENKGLNLSIMGGVIHGVEYLDTLKFKTKLSNPYNNFINPFFRFEILTKEGKLFFIEYYKDDINKIVTDNKNRVEHLKKQLSKQENQIGRAS